MLYSKIPNEEEHKRDGSNQNSTETVNDVELASASYARASNRCCYFIRGRFLFIRAYAWYMILLVILFTIIVSSSKHVKDTKEIVYSKSTSTDGLDHVLGSLREISSGFTIVTPTYQRESLLPGFLDHYAKGNIPSLQKILLLWVDTENKPPNWLLEKANSYPIPIHTILLTDKSLNERFRPYPEIETSCVFSLDDDILIDHKAVEAAYQTWAEIGKRTRMLGFTKRRVTKDRFRYELDGNGPYQLVLTKNAMFHVDWLKQYWSLDPLLEELRAFVTKGRNCEDILMSFLMAKYTRSGPIYFKAPLQDNGLVKGGIVKGFSNKPNHMEARTECVHHFMKSFGNDTLVDSFFYAQKS